MDGQQRSSLRKGHNNIAFVKNSGNSFVLVNAESKGKAETPASAPASVAPPVDTQAK